MTYKDDSKADLSLQETSQPATAFDSEIGQLTISGSTDSAEGSTYIIRAFTCDKERKKFCIVQNIAVFIAKSGSDVDIESEKQKL